MFTKTDYNLWMIVFRKKPRLLMHQTMATTRQGAWKRFIEWFYTNDSSRRELRKTYRAIKVHVVEGWE